MKTLNLIIFFSLASILPSMAWGEPSLWVIEVAQACSPTDYSIDQELKEIRAASTIAFSDAKKLFPSCKVSFHQHILRGVEDDLISFIGKVPRGPSPTAIIGFSRTNTARLAALTTKDTPIIGISVGAAAANVRHLNGNFYSVASSWENQWKAIRETLSERKCQKIIGVFNPSSFLSKLYLDKFQEAKIGAVYRTDNLMTNPLAPDVDCVFFGANYFDSVASLEPAVKSPSVRLIVTTGDWVMAQNEILKLELVPSRKLEILSASGWKDDRGRGGRLATALRLYGIIDPTPIAPYTYDATLFALNYLCNGISPSKMNLSTINSLLMRSYAGVNDTGNFISPIYMRALALKRPSGTIR